MEGIFESLRFDSNVLGVTPLDARVAVYVQVWKLGGLKIAFLLQSNHVNFFYARSRMLNEF